MIERARLRCAVCHASDGLLGICDGCGALAHEECRAAGCPTRGCKASKPEREVRAKIIAPTPAWSGWASRANTAAFSPRARRAAGFLALVAGLVLTCGVVPYWLDGRGARQVDQPAESPSKGFVSISIQGVSPVRSDCTSVGYAAYNVPLIAGVNDFTDERPLSTANGTSAALLRVPTDERPLSTANGTSAALLRVPTVTNRSGGARVVYLVEVSDGVHWDTAVGELAVSTSNVAGLVTASASAPIETVNSTQGILWDTWQTTVERTVVNVVVTPTWSGIVPTSVKIHWRCEVLR